MNALPIMLGALCVYALGYRYYSAFIAAKVLALDDSRVTPAHRFKDGHNFVPMNKWVLFGHHFAAIAGAGPLVGPVLAAQFGYAPGLLWLLAGAVLAGCVHDFTVLVASVRHNGRSLAEIARMEIGPVAGFTAGIAILFIIVIALAGLGLVVVNALADSPWGTFTIAMTIPIAIAMGLYMFKLKPGSISGPSVAGVVALIACVVGGRWVAVSVMAPYFTFNQHQLTILMAIYGFAASVLPVWLLLAPRDYLSSYMKIGTIAALVLGVLIVHPDLKFAAFTQVHPRRRAHLPRARLPLRLHHHHVRGHLGVPLPGLLGDDPQDAGQGDAGAVHRLRRDGHGEPRGHRGPHRRLLPPPRRTTTPSTSSPEKFAALGMTPVNLAELSSEVGENIAGRSGGAVSLAVGMAQIFSGIPGMKSLMSYWYHFAIMFEALFILTTIDAGTRVGRFLLQEFLGNFYKPFSNPSWLPGAISTTTAIVFGWAYFIYTGSVSTIWPMFGIANQLLAIVALAVVTTYLVNVGRARYAWVTLLPMCFVVTTTMTAGALTIKNTFLPLARTPGKAFQGYLNTSLTVIMMAAVIIILADAARRCWATHRGKPLPPQSGGRPEVREGVPQRCC